MWRLSDLPPSADGCHRLPVCRESGMPKLTFPESTFQPLLNRWLLVIRNGWILDTTEEVCQQGVSVVKCVFASSFFFFSNVVLLSGLLSSQVSCLSLPIPLSLSAYQIPLRLWVEAVTLSADPLGLLDAAPLIPEVSGVRQKTQTA